MVAQLRCCGTFQSVLVEMVCTLVSIMRVAASHGQSHITSGLAGATTQYTSGDTISKVPLPRSPLAASPSRFISRDAAYIWGIHPIESEAEERKAKRKIDGGVASA
ncbi:hypothetical protein ACS0PU_006612 [Formica fusca]